MPRGKPKVGSNRLGAQHEDDYTLRVQGQLRLVTETASPSCEAASSGHTERKVMSVEKVKAKTGMKGHNCERRARRARVKKGASVGRRREGKAIARNAKEASGE